MCENTAGLTVKFHVKNGKAMCTNEFAADPLKTATCLPSDQPWVTVQGAASLKRC